ncbi:MAG: hypothetical protein ACM3JD_17900 [Rudaea sp.]
MTEMGLDDEARLRDLLLNDLEETERELFARVHRLAGGCALLGYLDDHPREMLSVDDLAFHAHEPAARVETTLRELIALGLLRRMDVSGMTFFGLVEAPAARRQVHELFNWQRGWHGRLARLENLVNGHSRA